ncbi:MAG: hypothetical protein HQK63_09830 [Desulfamplus sp.]|nr:hypothetical protein [Desulfamplus sp.]
MKPRNREINIFNLSMLDVISGALGAFLIIMIVLFPYYKKDAIDYQRDVQQLTQQLQQIQQQVDEAQKKIETAQNEAEHAKAENEQTRQQLESAQRQLAKTFLVIYIRWSTKLQDIDLHVVDPSGAEFSFQNKTIMGRPGELSEDSIVGPGNEVWELFNAPVGNYQVYANLYDTRGNNEIPIINGRVIFRDGSRKLRGIQLTSHGKMLMAEITVNQDGSVSIRD